MNTPPFHLAFPVSNLVETRKFYTRVLQCSVGRESDRWIDFNFFGHQITAHLAEQEAAQMSVNQVDSKPVPIRHFGVILPWEQWDALVDRVKQNKVVFYIEPYTRFAGQVGEQRTFFIQDPCENFLEFKCFQNMETVFGSAFKSG